MKHEEIKKKILLYIEKNGLIKTGERILVAVSGGPDSIFLLHILNLYKNKFNIKLITCHINHNLRGEASKRDEIFTKRLSSQANIPFIVKNIDVSSFRKEKHLSLEDAARQLRLKTLLKTAEETKSQKIALGHTLDDLIETFFLNLLRGAGRKGLLGMGVKRHKFIKPLLSVSKKEIIDYLKAKNIDYKIDVTNWMKQYRRNFIRRELVPLIEKRLNIEVRGKISQLIEILGDEEVMLSRVVGDVMKEITKKTEDGLVVERDSFRRLQPAIQRRVIIKCFEEMAGEKSLNFKEIESLRDAISGKSSGLKFLLGKTIFYVGADNVLVQKKKNVQKVLENEKITLDVPSVVEFQGRYIIKTSVLKNLNGDIKNHNSVFFDLDAVHPPLVLRTRMNGDRFRPFGMKGEKKIKDFFIDKRIPFWKRDKIPIIADSKNILWLVGLRRSDMARIKNNTEKILKIEMRKIDK